MSFTGTLQRACSTPTRGDAACRSSGDGDAVMATRSWCGWATVDTSADVVAIRFGTRNSVGRRHWRETTHRLHPATSRDFSPSRSRGRKARDRAASRVPGLACRWSVAIRWSRPSIGALVILRIGKWQETLDGRATPRLRLNRERRPNQVGAMTHTRKTRTVQSRRVRAESFAVVTNDQRGSSFARRETDLDTL